MSKALRACKYQALEAFAVCERRIYGRTVNGIVSPPPTPASVCDAVHEALERADHWTGRIGADVTESDVADAWGPVFRACLDAIDALDQSQILFPDPEVARVVGQYKAALRDLDLHQREPGQVRIDLN